MKIINLAIILLFTSVALFAQVTPIAPVIVNSIQKNAVMELTSGDIIVCTTRNPTYDLKKITYWLEGSKKKLQIPSESIKSIELTDKYDEVQKFFFMDVFKSAKNKKISKKKKWCELIVEGKYNLYKMHKVGEIEDGEYDTWYVKSNEEQIASQMINKNASLEALQLIDFEKFRKFFRSYFKDYPDAIAKIDLKTYADNRFIDLIEEINALN